VEAQAGGEPPVTIINSKIILFELGLKIITKYKLYRFVEKNIFII